MHHYCASSRMTHRGHSMIWELFGAFRALRLAVFSAVDIRLTTWMLVHHLTICNDSWSISLIYWRTVFFPFLVYLSLHIHICIYMIRIRMSWYLSLSFVLSHVVHPLNDWNTLYFHIQLWCFQSDCSNCCKFPFYGVPRARCTLIKFRWFSYIYMKIENSCKMMFSFCSRQHQCHLWIFFYW